MHNRRNRKFNMIIMMSVTAILLSYTYTVQAVEVVVYKCQNAEKIVFQDRVCAAGSEQEHFVYSYVEPTTKGLRPQEQFIVEQTYIRVTK